MTTRTRTILLVIIFIIVTFALAKFIMSFKKEIQEVVKEESVKGVRVLEAALDSNVAHVNFSGKLVAHDRIEIFSEVSGILLNDNFREGVRISKGETIISVESGEVTNNIRAQKSILLNQVALLMGDIKIDFSSETEKWELFLNQIEVNKPLPSLPEVSDVKFKRFISGKNIYNTYYTIKGLEERLSKYHVSAPFDGVITQANLKKGALIRANQKLGEFINLNEYELVTEVSIGDLKYLQVGYPVNLHSDDINKDWVGKIARINSKVEESSQMVSLFVKLAGSDLKEGMFLKGHATGSSFPNSVKIDRKWINDNTVFVVNDSIVTQKAIQILHQSSDYAIVSGIDGGDKLLIDNSKGIYNGMKVTVMN